MICSKSQNEIQNVEPSVIVRPHREHSLVMSLLFYPFIIVVLHIAVFIGTLLTLLFSLFDYFSSKCTTDFRFNLICSNVFDKI
jgi:hypothetical protein